MLAVCIVPGSLCFLVVLCHPACTCHICCCVSCPAGAAQLSDDGGRHNSSHDGPTYTNVAALQDLVLAVFPEPDASTKSSDRSSANSSSTGSFSSSSSNVSSAATLEQGSTTRNLLLRVDKPCNRSGSGGCSNTSSEHSNATDEAATATGPAAAGAASVIDLDPPFRPMVDRYIALLPPRSSGTSKLLLASSRWGDVVVVDATACDVLDTARSVLHTSLCTVTSCHCHECKSRSNRNRCTTVVD